MSNELKVFVGVELLLLTWMSMGDWLDPAYTLMNAMMIVTALITFLLPESKECTTLVMIFTTFGLLMETLYIAFNFSSIQCPGCSTKKFAAGMCLLDILFKAFAVHLLSREMRRRSDQNRDWNKRRVTTTVLVAVQSVFTICACLGNWMEIGYIYMNSLILAVIVILILPTTCTSPEGAKQVIALEFVGFAMDITFLVLNDKNASCDDDGFCLSRSVGKTFCIINLVWKGLVTVVMCAHLLCCASLLYEPEIDGNLASNTPAANNDTTRTPPANTGTTQTPRANSGTTRTPRANTGTAHPGARTPLIPPSPRPSAPPPEYDALYPN